MDEVADSSEEPKMPVLPDVIIEIIPDTGSSTSTNENSSNAGVINGTTIKAEIASEPSSKFQRYQSKLIKILKDSRSNGDERIHSFQREAVLEVLDMVKRDQLSIHKIRNEPILIVAPPGSGKTFIEVMLGYVLGAKKVLVITASPILSDQIAASFGKSRSKKSLFEKTGLCMDELDPSSKFEVLGAKSDVQEPVSVIKEQLDLDAVYSNVTIINVHKFGGKSGTTLSKTYGNPQILEDVKGLFTEYDLCIVDEAHHLPAATWKKIVDVYKECGLPKEKRNVIFVTATPFKANGDPILGELQKDRVITVKLDDLQGKTVRKLEFQEMPELINPTGKDTGSVATVGNQIYTSLKDQLYKEPNFVPQAMIMVSKVEDAKMWEKNLNEWASKEYPNEFRNPKDDNPKDDNPKDDAVGVNTTVFAVAIVSDPKSDSQELTKKFSKGEYRVAIICNLLKEGYDNPKVTLCVILRKIRSRVLFEQFVGRCMRLNRKIPNKRVDTSTGIIISWPNFGQKKMWNARLKLAEEDPTDDEDIPESSTQKRRGRPPGSKNKVKEDGCSSSKRKRE